MTKKTESEATAETSGVETVAIAKSQEGAEGNSFVTKEEVADIVGGLLDRRADERKPADPDLCFVTLGELKGMLGPNTGNAAPTVSNEEHKAWERKYRFLSYFERALSALIAGGASPVSEVTFTTAEASADKLIAFLDKKFPANEPPKA